MDKQKEIEKMKKIICSVEGTPCSDCPFRFDGKCAAEINVTALYNAGYGDVKQAVREFAERLGEIFFRNVFINGDVNVRGKWYTSKEVIREIIDELIKEARG